jgi:hypothetical protein
MLGGIVFVLTSIVHKANAEMGEQHCNDTVLHLEGHGTLSGVVPQGKTVQVTIVSGADTKVLTLDRCTGTLLHTFTVTP